MRKKQESFDADANVLFGGEVNIAEEEPPKMRRKMKRQDTAEQEDLFAPKPKDKIKDEFAEKEKKPKEEVEKIVITPAVLPAKPEPAVEAIPEVPEEEAEETKRAEKDKVRDGFEEKERKRKEEEEKIIIKPAVLPLKKKVESWEEESEEEEEEETPAKKKLRKNYNKTSCAAVKEEG